MRGARLVVGALFVASVGASVVAACGHRAPPTQLQPASSKVDAELAPLHAFEEARRAATDFAHLPPSDDVLGANPYELRAIANGAHFIGILRGADAIVLLDRSLHEVQRLPAPKSPSGLAIGSDGTLVVSGEESASLGRYGVDGDRLFLIDTVPVQGALAIRDVAIGPEGAIHVVEAHDGRLITLRPNPGGGFTQSAAFVGNGPIAVMRTRHFVLVDALLDHRIVVRKVDADGVPLTAGEQHLDNDGPFWSFDAVELDQGFEKGDGSLIVAAGHVEDHPLDRTGGFFGYIDSFVSVFSIGDKTGVKRRSTTNVSALGVITPKAIALRVDATGGRATIVGYGGESMATLRWSPEGVAAPKVTTASLPPGGNSIVALDDGSVAVANPLLDAFVLAHDGTADIVPVEDPKGAREVEVRLGEALFFTNLMAPFNGSDGAHSRFTCETCHFEGHVDGRTHHTGRGDVHATTKPLVGLFNNRPHFTRALDPDLTTVAHAEFRVAGALSGHDPWFSTSVAEHPWLGAIGAGKTESIAPERLRKSLMTFLMTFTHRPNPKVLTRQKFTDDERAGAELFRTRCVSCHAARLVTDDPSSEVPFDRWESMIFTREDPIVWASAPYRTTGVVPYVHELGARTTSLRRLFEKRPYFTNGVAKDLDQLLSLVRFDASGAFFHVAPSTQALQSLDAAQRRALAAFLDLL